MRLSRLAILLVAVAACRSDSPTGPVQTPQHYPIIFVHGFLSSTAIWNTMIGRFKADGWTDRELATLSYDFNQSNTVTAQRLGASIDSVLAATGARHVDIITHSMGSLSARYYMRNVLARSDTSTKVDAIVSLAGTNHGTAAAVLCASASCIEMRPNSTFLSELNAGDETWGTPRYATWWSPCDEAVLPAQSATLVGAVNTETGCIGHSDLYLDPGVYAQVREWVRPTRYGP